MQTSFGLAREASKLRAIPTTRSSRRLSGARHNMRGSGDVSFALGHSLCAAWKEDARCEGEKSGGKDKEE